jgi:hypothetical protein
VGKFSKYVKPQELLPPDVAPVPEEPGMLSKALGYVPQPVKTTVGTVLDILGRPGAATAGAVAGAFSDAPGMKGSALERGWENLKGNRRDDFDQVLEEQGMKDSVARKVAGFAGDLIIDPLNLVGVGVVKNVAKGAAKAAHLAEGAELVGKGLGKLDALTGGTGAAVRDAAGKLFVPRYGTSLAEGDIAALGAAGKVVGHPDEFKDTARFFEREKSTIPARTEKAVIDRYKGTTQAERLNVGPDLEAGAGLTQRADDLMLQQKKVNDDLFKKEVDNLVQKPESLRTEYAPHDYSRTIDAGKKDYTNAPNSAFNAKNKFARARKDPERTWAEAVQHGAEPDIALAQLTRESVGETKALTGGFIKKTTEKYGLKVDVAPADWRTLTKLPMESPLGKFTEDMAFPKHIAEYLDKAFEGPGKKTAIGELYDKALNAWRTQATVLRPAFHVKNFMGNTFQSYLSNMNPIRFVEAATWDSAKAAGALKGAPKIGNYHPAVVADFMERFGVGGAGHSFTNELMQEGADTVLKAALDGKTLSKNPLKHPIRAARSVGQGVEDFSKRALFLDQLHKGETLEEAAKTVDKFLFDYGDLTAFERQTMKRIFPFYTWMRKNIPLQVEQVVKQPHKYAAIDKGTNALENAAKDEGTFTQEGNRPEYLQGNNAVQLPTEKGKSKKYWSPSLPYDDLNKLPIPGGTDIPTALRKLGSSIDPVVKAGAELALNKSFFFNKPLYDEKLGPMVDNQKINSYLEYLPESLKSQLFTETIGPDGKAQYEMPAAVKYALQQLPAMESAGKQATAITNPTDAENPGAQRLSTLGLSVTERTAAQEAKDKSSARIKARSAASAERKQNRKPAKKAQVDSLFKKYLAK